MDEPRAPDGEAAAFRPGCCAGLGAACLLLLAVPPFLLYRGTAPQDEVARVPAPGGRLHAVLVEIGGGAATDDPAYSVRLEGMSWLGFEQEVARLSAARRPDCARGVALRWAAPDRLLIEYRHAARVRTVPAEVGGRGVRVELRPGVADPGARCSS